MRFGVLGPLAVWTADGEPVNVPEAKVRVLLAALLVNLGQPVSADRLIDHLWGPAAPAKALNTLQTKVSQLRRVLEAAEPGRRDLLTHRPGGYVLDADAQSLDANRFTTLITRARAAHQPQARADLFTEAMALWRGPVLADLRDEPVAQAVITRLEEDRLTAVEEHAQARLDLGEHSSLAAELTDLVAAHPLRERLRAVQLRALYRAGRQSAAVTSFHDLRERLADQLGVDPSPDLAALYQAILEQDPDLQPPAPAPAATSTADAGSGSDRALTPRTNLPTPLTDLIGRDTAVADIRARLATSRLVTLTGPGGVGKTRLSLAVAHGARADGETGGGTADGADGHPDAEPPDEIWFVEFAALPPAVGDSPTTVEDVADLTAVALGLRDAPGTRASAPQPAAADALDRLTGAVRQRRMLLVLDNCEHVVEPVAELAQRLLAAAPGLRVLATSREALRVSGEQVWNVPPLELPAAAATQPDVLETFSATRLFVARAAAAAPGFSLTEHNAAPVAAICRRLDGIPLALELAASRVNAFGVHQLAERLDDRFRLLSAGKRGVPARQRTLWAMIDWSWQLLDTAERSVLRRLAVYADGATLDAVQAVCSGPNVPAADVVDVLARLVDRSLVVATHNAEGTRYSLLESVSAYCREQLTGAGETADVARRHRLYYLDLAEQAEPELYGSQQCVWLARLSTESANLRRALDSAIGGYSATVPNAAGQAGQAASQDDDATDHALRLVNALAWYWYLRGRQHEASRSLARALAAAGSAPASVVARARSWHAGMSILEGARRAEPSDSVLKLFDDTDDAHGRARAQWLLGYAEYSFGDLAASERMVDDALTGFRRTGDTWGIAAALGLRASQAVVHSDLPAVRHYSDESAALFARTGDGWGRLYAIGTRGTYAEITGDYAGAASLYRDGLRIAEYLELWSEYSAMLSRLGRIEILNGNYAEADLLHERAGRLAAQQSNVGGEEVAGIGLALSARRQGNLDTAEALLRRWLTWNQQVEVGYGSALLLAELGFVAELRGDADAARSLHTDGLAAARSTGDPRAVALALEGLAGADSLAGQFVRGARLLGAATAARESVGAPLPSGERTDVDRITARTRRALGDETFAAEFRNGTTLNENHLA